MYFLYCRWCVLLVLPLTILASDPTFRDDYVYDSGAQAFFKEHTEKLTWQEAVNTCAVEGAQLAAPATRAGLLALRRHLSNESVIIWTGIHSLYAPGYFITLNGIPTSKMYIDWGSNEPNNLSGDEYCVEFSQNNLKFNDRSCSTTSPFICQKELSTLTRELANKGVGSVTPFFREDYTYESAFRTFYKAHGRSAKWSDAMFECEAEGAELAAPDSEGEMRMMLKYMTWSATSLWNIVWVGIHDQYSEGNFITLNGTSVSQTYINWASGEPNNVNGNEHCARLLPEGVYYDDNCEAYWRFICKKRLSAVTTANPLCETYDTEYLYSIDANRCYKLHTVPRNWYDAFKICQSEGSYLGIINSQDEVNIYKDILGKYSTSSRQFNKSLIHLGFNDLLRHGQFISLDDEKPDDGDLQLDGHTRSKTPLAILLQQLSELQGADKNGGESSWSIGRNPRSPVLPGSFFNPSNERTGWKRSYFASGYDAWSEGQPDNLGGNERCGSLLLSDGKLNDVGCHINALFICEKNILRPISLDSSLRYGEAEVKLCA